MENVRTPWIQTFTGHQYPLLHPSPSDILIEDIAHALSNVCRFSGHCRKFYSVAQHSFLCSLMVPTEFAMDALLHDASEAYLGDLSRPLKYSDYLVGYRRIEMLTEEAIAEKFCLEIPRPTCIKTVDNKMLVTERRDLVGITEAGWEMDIVATPYTFRIDAWPPEKAEKEFLWRFGKLNDRGSTWD